MNGSPSVTVALFIRNGGSESPCRWFYVTGIYNEKTLHAVLLLAGITQLVTVLVADKIHQYQYIRNLKPLIA